MKKYILYSLVVIIILGFIWIAVLFIKDKKEETNNYVSYNLESSRNPFFEQDTLEPPFKKAIFFEKEGDFDSAMTEYTRIAKTNETYFDQALFRKAAISKTNEALNDYIRIIEHHKYDDPFLMIDDTILMKSYRYKANIESMLGKPDSSLTVHSKNIVELTMGVQSDQLKNLNNYKDNLRRLAESFESRSIAFERLNELGHAIADYQWWIENLSKLQSYFYFDPPYSDLLRMKFNLRQNRFDEAYSNGKKALNAGKLDEAINYLNTAVSLDSLNAEAYLTRGSIFFKMDSMLLAINDFTTSYSLESSSYTLYQRGIAYMESGNLEKATNDMKTVIQQLPYSEQIASSPPQSGFGEDFLLNRIRQLTNFIEKNPDSKLLPTAYRNRAMDYLHHREFDLALKDFDSSIDLGADENWRNYLGKGMVYEEMHQMNEAIEAYDMSIQLARHIPDGYYFRGRAYFIQDDTIQSKLDYWNYLKYKYNMPSREKIIDQYDSLLILNKN